MLLTVQNLEVCYGVISALQDVSLSIDRGEIVTLIGANGAGKTTLLRTISGLLTPTRGSILYQGGEIAQPLPHQTAFEVGPPTQPADARQPESGRPPIELLGLKPHEIVSRGISHVPEGRQVFPNHTVRENLQLGGYQQKSRSQLNADIDRIYSHFPVLSERRSQKAGTLSGGEQQMLAIGRALMAHPQLLLLDEPSLGLAPLVVRKIFQIIKEINAEGTTIFLVEQNAHMALTVAHRGYVLQTGQVILTDSAANLLQHPDVKKAYLGG